MAAGAQTERRGDAGSVRSLLGGKDLTGRFSSWRASKRSLDMSCRIHIGLTPRRSPDDSIFLCFDAQQFRGLSTSAHVLFAGAVLLEPLDGLIVPLSRLSFVAELPVGHGQKQGGERAGGSAG